MKLKLGLFSKIFLAVALATASLFAEETAKKAEVLPLIVMEDAPLKDAISNLARQAGMNVQVDSSIPQSVFARSVTFRWENTTAKAALLALLDTHQLELVENETTKMAQIVAKKTSDEVRTSPPPGAPAYATIGTAVAKGSNLIVRGLPSLKGDRITKLQKGETVTLLEEIDVKKPKKDEPAKWFRIALPTNTPVWIHADFIDPANMTIRPKKLNVRAGPSENHNIVARMEKGETVKQIRKVNDWIEIEPPATAFAFVAAQFLEKEKILPTAPPPTEVAELTPAEVVAVPPVEEAKPAVDVPAEPATVPAEPATTAATPEPALPTPEPEKVSEVLPKRIVKREGNVRRAINIQAPTYFELENLDGKLINYLHSPEEIVEDPMTKKMKVTPKFNLKELIGRTVIVTGEESMDKRWTRTPVLEIESIDVQ